MQFAEWFHRAGGRLILGILMIGGGAAAAQDDAPRTDGPPPGRPVRTVVRHMEPGFQLQMGVGRVPKALDAQLQLDGQGVLVTMVQKDGPADKAGIKEHDILLSADDEPLKNPSDLSKIVKDSQGGEITVTLRRAGDALTVTVTPEKSHEAIGVFQLDGARIKLDGDQIRVNISELRDVERTIRNKVKDLGVDLRMHVIEPGAWLPRGAEFSFGRRTDLPEDLSIDIRKQGKEPADIEVRKGDESWAVKENDLKSLPDDVRRHVEGYLGRGPMRFNVVDEQDEYYSFGVRLPHPGKGPQPPGPPRGDRPAPPDGPGTRGQHGDRPNIPDIPGRIEERLERRLEEMTRRMEQMHEQLEGLRHHLRDEFRDRPSRPRRPDRPHEEDEESDKDEA